MMSKPTNLQQTQLWLRFVLENLTEKLKEAYEELKADKTAGFKDEDKAHQYYGVLVIVHAFIQRIDESLAEGSFDQAAQEAFDNGVATPLDFVQSLLENIAAEISEQLSNPEYMDEIIGFVLNHSVMASEEDLRNGVEKGAKWLVEYIAELPDTLDAELDNARPQEAQVVDPDTTERFIAIEPLNRGIKPD